MIHPNCGGVIEEHRNYGCQCCTWAICNKCDETISGPSPAAMAGARSKLKREQALQQNRDFYSRLYTHRSSVPQ